MNWRFYTTTDEPESPSQPAYETPVLGKVVAHEYEYDKNDPIYTTTDEPIYATID